MAIPAYNPPPAAKPNPALAALGVANEDGAVKWPLALRLVPPDQKRELDKLESQLQTAGTQAAAGQVNPLVVDSARMSVISLHQWLRARRDSLPKATFREADLFLQKLDDTLQGLNRGKG